MELRAAMGLIADLNTLRMTAAIGWSIREPPGHIADPENVAFFFFWLLLLRASWHAPTLDSLEQRPRHRSALTGPANLTVRISSTGRNQRPSLPRTGKVPLTIQPLSPVAQVLFTDFGVNRRENCGFHANPLYA